MQKKLRGSAGKFSRTHLGLALAAAFLGFSGGAQAVTIDAGPDWKINADTSIQYTTGWRASGRDQLIANDPNYSAGDYKFDRGDMVTNRVQGIFEFQGIYRNNFGFRLSGSAWNDFAYDDDVKSHPTAGYPLPYTGGHYSTNTKKYTIRGAELLDAFVFGNVDIANTPVNVKLGRLTQYWGNGFFFPFTSISYGQNPIDYVKGFTQPGSEVKELFLPRGQALVTAELAPGLLVSGQYFMEYRQNRFPEGGTYLAPADFMFEGPNSSATALGPGATAGTNYFPKDNNKNFGIKLAWSPDWLGGDLGFYYRRLDEPQGWALADFSNGVGNFHQNFAENVKLYGISFEKSLGLLSLGLEASLRTDTALMSSAVNPNTVGLGLPYNEGARGDIVNILANTFIQLGSSPLWSEGVFLAEVAYTHLNKVTKNEEVFSGVGHNGCKGPGAKERGCATKDAVAVAVSFTPSWLQALPSIDLSMPISATYGLHGNPAYSAGGFYSEKSLVWSIGISANYMQKHKVTLQYQDYYWPSEVGVVTPAGGLPRYAGGNGTYNLNDRGWVSLTYKTSF